jgi:hypothetical protein
MQTHNLPGFTPNKNPKVTSIEYLKLIKTAAEDEENFNFAKSPKKKAQKTTSDHEISEVSFASPEKSFTNTVRESFRPPTLLNAPIQEEDDDRPYSRA